MRATLLARVRVLLTRAGFYLSEDAAMRPMAFDLVGRRDDELVIVKVLTNVDGLSEPVANELRLVARFLDATPLVVGERSSSRDLEPGAVYLRYGVKILHYETLSDYLEDGVAPLVYAAPGGFYVNLDGERLRQLREQRGLSLGDLAQAAGVSRRAIGMYEEGMGTMVEVAARLEEFLDEPLVTPLDPFVPPSEDVPKPTLPTAPTFARTFEGTVLHAMLRLGFDVAPTTKSPFNAITRNDPASAGASGHGFSPASLRDDGEAPGSRATEAAEPPRRFSGRIVLTGFLAETPDALKRAAATANLCQVTETHGAIFVEKSTTRVAIEGTPVVTRDELKRIDDPHDLIELLLARRGRR